MKNSRLRNRQDWGGMGCSGGGGGGGGRRGEIKYKVSTCTGSTCCTAACTLMNESLQHFYTRVTTYLTYIHISRAAIHITCQCGSTRFARSATMRPTLDRTCHLFSGRASSPLDDQCCHSSHWTLYFDHPPLGPLKVSCKLYLHTYIYMHVQKLEKFPSTMGSTLCHLLELLSVSESFNSKPEDRNVLSAHQVPKSHWQYSFCFSPYFPVEVRILKNHASWPIRLLDSNSCV